MNVTQSPARARYLQHRPNQYHPPRFTGPSGANSSARSPSSATIVQSPSRAWSVLPYPFETSHRASSDPSSYSLYTARLLTDPGPTKINLRPAHSTSSRNANCGSARLQRHRTESSPRGVTVLTYCPPWLVFSSNRPVSVSLWVWVGFVYQCFLGVVSRIVLAFGSVLFLVCTTVSVLCWSCIPA